MTKRTTNVKYFVREPIQKRAIEKKNKIIHAGFKMFCEKGYYKTNTKQIAKVAGVSTGIVYQYFEDKHDILLSILSDESIKIFNNKPTKISKDLTKEELTKYIRLSLCEYVDSHIKNEHAHNEIMSMVYNDKAVAEAYFASEQTRAEEVANRMLQGEEDTRNMREKAYIIGFVIDGMAHEVAYRKHDIDKDAMIDVTTDLIVDLLTK